MASNEVEGNISEFDWNTFMKIFIDLSVAVSNLIWPLLLILVIFIFRDKISSLLSVAIQRIEAASEIEIAGLKIKGIEVTHSGNVLRGDKTNISIVAAKKSDQDRRDAIYAKTRNLFLVHTIKPTEPKRFQGTLPVFEVSVYIAAHRHRGNINDIKHVTFYFGDKWGKSKFGSKYIVKSANNYFALSSQMWGACWCTAEISFHNSAELVTLERYLDVEMAPLYGIPLEEARDGGP